jgi:pilus assembly protein CpaB
VRGIFALVLLLGLGIAGTAVYMAMTQFNLYETQLAEARNKPTVDLTKVYITKKDLRYGQKLKKSDVRSVKWPVKAVPKTAFTKLEDLIGASAADARTVLRTMDAGEMIMSTKVTKPGQDAGVASQLKTGFRAFALRVDVVSGVSGFLRPGDRVDVIWNGNVGGSKITKIILNNVELIGIDQITDTDRNKAAVARTVTVMVSPRTVAAIVQAQSTGKLVLSLVGVNDLESSGDIQINQRELLGIVVNEVAKKKKCTIRTRKGGEAVTITIPCTN